MRGCGLWASEIEGIEITGPKGATGIESGQRQRHRKINPEFFPNITTDPPMHATLSIQETVFVFDGETGPRAKH